MKKSIKNLIFLFLIFPVSLFAQQTEGDLIQVNISKKKIQKPVIVWESPLQASIEVKEAFYAVLACIQSQEKLKSVEVYVNKSLQKGIKVIESSTTDCKFKIDRKIELKAGENALYIIATNSGGSVTSETKVINYQKTVTEKPVIVWENPLPNDVSVKESSFSLKACIKSTEKLKKVEVYLNKSLQKGINEVESSGVDCISKIDKKIELKEGDNSIYIIATNSGGSVTSETKIINYQKPAPEKPVIVWENPLPNNVSVKDLSYSIKACIKSAEKLKKVEIYVNNSLQRGYNIIESDETDCIAKIDKKINLKEGDNSVYIIAANSVGSTTSDTKIIYYKKPVTKPLIVWENPKLNNLNVTDPLFTLMACIKSEEDLQTIDLYLNNTLQKESKNIRTENDCRFNFEKKITLNEGINSIYILSVNSAGSTTSEIKTITYQKPVKKEKRVALVIGNSDYSFGGALRNPVNDAADMADTLKKIGFEVVKMLNADFGQLGLAIEEFGEKTKDADISMFYYAGHGVQVNGTNYLIPTNAKIDQQNEVKFKSVDAGLVLAKMESSQSKVNIVVLDACRDNPFERSWKRGAKGSGLATMEAPTGSIVAYATQPGNTAADGTKRNGLYTSALLQYITSPGMTIEQVFKKVRTRVLLESNKQQQPWESTSLTGEDVYLVK